MKALLVLIIASGIVVAAPQPKIIYEQDKSLLVTTIDVVISAGSQDDPGGKNGVMNLMSELILRGTKKKSRTQFQSELERMGATLGVHTAGDSIHFTGAVILENTMPFLRLVQECLLHPGFQKKEFEDLKREILAYVANIKNNNARLSGLTLRKHFFANTPLERPVEGGLSTVKQISLDDLQKAYNNFFHRGNLIFAISSALPESDISPWANEVWSGFPDGMKRQPHSIPFETPKSPVVLLVHKPKTATGSMMFGQAGITAQDPLRYTLGTGNFSFGGEPLVARLFRIVRAELGYTYGIFSTYSSMGQLTYQKSFYIISSTPSIEFTAKTLFKTWNMWKEYLEHGLKSDEMTLAKESLVNSYPFEFDSAEKRLSQKLRSYMYNVPLYTPEEYAKVIGEVNNTGLIKALKDRQTPDGWVISIVADKDVIAKELAEEQKDVPKDKQLTISKVFTPEEVIE